MSIYIAHRRKNNASNVLNVPSTVQKETSSLYDENSQLNMILFVWSKVSPKLSQPKSIKYACDMCDLFVNGMK